MAALRRASGRWTAQVALLVQLFAAGFATAVHAVAPRADAFGNVLCLSGQSAADQPAGGTSRIHECCTFGCGGVVPSFAKPADPLVQPVIYSGSIVVSPAGPTIPAAYDRQTRPGSPRAPPAAF